MKEYEAGRESSILAYMLDGRKTIEIRLNRGKFAQFKPGDRVRIREDVYQNGKVINEVPDRVISEIIKVNRYKSFKELFEAEGTDNTIPFTTTIEDAVKVCRKFYTEDDEKRYGVLAIHFRIIKKPGRPE